MPAPRPPSRAVMSKSTTSNHDENHDIETNIQVIICCRRRSEREIQDNSPIIVSSSRAHSHEVTIESSVPLSSLSVVTLPLTRTYLFDVVFGPEADQAMIYHDVVTPMLSEVLQGYNYTLFMYGHWSQLYTSLQEFEIVYEPEKIPVSQHVLRAKVFFQMAYPGLLQPLNNFGISCESETV
jgi:kinesin family member 11